MLPNQLLVEGFGQWLNEMRGSRGGSISFRPAIAPDSLSTSVRSASTVQSWLTSISQGTAIEGSDRRRRQAVTDMRNPMGLVAGDNDAPFLTPFGWLVLDRWQELGLTNGTDAHDIARWASLMRIALFSSDVETRQRYLPKYLAWRRLSQLPNAGYWLKKDLIRLYLPYYLSISDSRGYRPFEVFVALSGGRIGESNVWKEWAASDWEFAPHLSDLLKYIVGTYRVGGSLNYRRALEVIRLAEDNPGDLGVTLTSWEISA